MARPITLYTGQWTDLPLEEVCKVTGKIGYNGLELACWGDHFEVSKSNKQYCENKLELIQKHGLQIFALSNHLVGQAVCDETDARHQKILPDYIWGNGNPKEVQKRAAEEMIKTAHAAKNMGLTVVNGFTGSSVWKYVYSFPPTPDDMIEEGYSDFAKKWIPILDEYQKLGIKFALEVHPTEIAFDTITAERALNAVNNHPAFGFNFDPSHFAYQGVDYIDFIDTFSSRIFHSHIKDVTWTDGPAKAGLYGGYLGFGDYRRKWNFCSPGRGKVNFDAIVRAFNRIGYTGSLSIEWEDNGMDRLHGLNEAYNFIKGVDFQPSAFSFDKAFKKQ